MSQNQIGISLENSMDFSFDYFFYWIGPQPILPDSLISPSRMREAVELSKSQSTQLRSETWWITLYKMQESFVDGRDGEFFDYAEVDGDSDLDDLDEEDRDAEEKYFDGD